MARIRNFNSFQGKKRIEISNKLQDVKDGKFLVITSDESILASLVKNENVPVQNIVLINEKRGVDVYDNYVIIEKIKKLEEV